MPLTLTIKPGVDFLIEHPDGTRILITFNRKVVGPHKRWQAHITAPREVRVSRVAGIAGVSRTTATPPGPTATER